jgi:uncharacterized protein YyaL (SSP411 family)
MPRRQKCVGLRGFIKLAYTDNGKYRDLAEQALAIIGNLLCDIRLFARWLSAAENAQGNTKQVAVLGEAGRNTERMLKVIEQNIDRGGGRFPTPHKGHARILHERGLIDGKAAYVCEGFVCKQPTNDPKALAEQMTAKDAKRFYESRPMLLKQYPPRVA